MFGVGIYYDFFEDKYERYTVSFFKILTLFFQEVYIDIASSKCFSKFLEIASTNVFSIKKGTKKRD